MLFDPKRNSVQNNIVFSKNYLNIVFPNTIKYFQVTPKTVNVFIDNVTMIFNIRFVAYVSKEGNFRKLYVKRDTEILT